MSSNGVYRYTNESCSGCDMTASITVRHLDKKSGKLKNFTYVVGELQTISYSINMDKTPVRSIGNVNAKDYVPGQRTIAGSIVFNVFNRHFSKELMNGLNDNYEGTSYLVDEIPPFDVTISAASEYGYRSKLCIFGIRLLNEGQVMSINDVFVENTYQFYATDVDYLDDEMKYSKNKKGLHYLNDNKIKWVAPKELNVSMDKPLSYDNYGYVADNSIKLSVGVKQPAGDRKNGIADFYITPGIQVGKVVIEKDGEGITVISIRTETADPTDNKNEWYKNNKTSHVNKKLSPGIYTAYAEDSKGVKSNKVKFNVIELKKIDKLKGYAPTIKNVTNTSFTVIPIEPLHDEVKVVEGRDINSNGTIYKVGKQITITDLKEETAYAICTLESSTGLTSPATVVKTRSEKDSAYKKLGLSIYSNSRLLVHTGNVKRYLEILELAYNNSNKTGASILDALMNIRREFISKLNNSTDNEESNKINLDVKMISEIIGIQNKILLKERVAINKETFTSPTLYLDDNCNVYFEFDEKTTFAEFYKVNEKMNFFKQGVDARIFKEIDGKKNCFRYIGEAGTHNYVEAISKNMRSDRLDFYIMTNEEKSDYSNSVFNKSNIPIRVIEQKRKELKDEISEKLTRQEENMAFMYKLNECSPVIDVPYIDKTEDSIIIKSSIKYLDPSGDKTYYYCIASLDEIINGDLIYKIPFDPLTSEVKIGYEEHDLIYNKEYSCWIENDLFIKISNSSSFIYNEEYMNNIVSEFEFSNEYRSLIANANKNRFSMENNSFINSYNAVIIFLSELFKAGCTENNCIQAIKNIERNIGIKADISPRLIDVKVDNNKLEISGDNLIIVIYDIKNMEVKSKKIIDKEEIELNGSEKVICCHSEDLKEKSQILFINNFNVVRRV